ncbi:MAG: hypothetical protein ACXAEU_02690 [Candidatus Hodarchaeales archaeon]|jgi:hypothetical protein
MSFKETWNNMTGMNPRKIVLGNHVTAINSWTAALAMLEVGKSEPIGRNKSHAPPRKNRDDKMDGPKAGTNVPQKNEKTAQRK